MRCTCRYAGLAIGVSGREACEGARVGKRVRYTSKFTTFNQDNDMQVEDYGSLPLDVRHSRRRVGAGRSKCQAHGCTTLVHRWASIPVKN